ncbi:hypothetical protein EYZ11_012521 [Aspergillus tanneri]|uniref:C2H2-type domain-containing protein n=1 Tax=Aspergillus tanneri TaxID=1220188 RepID=A0A4S3J262_9EURO|nr:hypothetical protein EYZ11_012521 [Aspergillus tanneri]
MDLFIYNPVYRLWICTPCGYAVTATDLNTHLAKRHTGHHSATSRSLRQAAWDQMQRRPWLDPSKEPCPVAGPDSAPIEGLPIFRGLGCPRCDYVARSPAVIAGHYRKTHARDAPPGLPRPPWRPVQCQRFFSHGAGSSFFVVIPPRPAPVPLVSESEFTHTQLVRDLQARRTAVERANGVAPTSRGPTEVCPWLDLTQWPRYIGGHGFTAVAQLGALPDPTTEPVLAAVAESVARLVRHACGSIRERKIKSSTSSGLTDTTYRRYTQVWQRLVCFAYRTGQPNSPTRLNHSLTRAQSAWLCCLTDRARAVQEPGEGHRTAEAQALLDQACLYFSISLLDHTLRGDLFESVVVRFLAVLGVDANRQVYRDACSYTSFFSALVKVAQLLVIQQAVRAAADGEVPHPAAALDEMRGRFMVYWSDDQQTLFYQGLELGMSALRNFAQL